MAVTLPLVEEVAGRLPGQPCGSQADGGIRPQSQELLLA